MTNAGNISLLEFVTNNTGSAFSLISYAANNEIEINSNLLPGQILKQISFEELEPDNFKELFLQLFKPKNEVMVIQGQSLIDLAINQLGSALSIIELAIENKIAVDDLLKVGKKIIIPITETNEVVNYFKASNQLIATYKTQESEPVIKLIYELPGEFPYSF